MTIPTLYRFEGLACILLELIEFSFLICTIHGILFTSQLLTHFQGYNWVPKGCSCKWKKSCSTCSSKLTTCLNCTWWKLTTWGYVFTEFNIAEVTCSKASGSLENQLNYKNTQLYFASVSSTLGMRLYGNYSGTWTPSSTKILSLITRCPQLRGF